MTVTHGHAALPPAGRVGWSRLDWRIFRRLYQLALRLPAPLLAACSRPPPSPEGVAPIDARAHFHAWFVRRVRKPVAVLPEAQRRPALFSIALLEGPRRPGVECTDLTIAGAGGRLPVRLYRPQSAPAHAAPVLVYLHFGGCVLGNLETCDTACSVIAERAGCLVLSVDYRLAPEHRFPAALEDSLSALCWVRQEANRLGADPDRVAIGGDSAGGYLAAAASLSLRDAGEALPFAQVLIYPVLEMDRRAMPPTPFDNSYPLSRDDMIWFSDLYMRDARDAEDPRCSVARAATLAGLPPTLLVQAGHDLLFAEGASFAERLASEGVELFKLVYPSLPHAFTAMSGGVPDAEAALIEIADLLASVFADGPDLLEIGDDIR